MRKGVLMLAAMLAFPLLNPGVARAAPPKEESAEAQTLFNDARELAARERMQDAMDAYARLARRWPQLPEVHNNLGILQMRAGLLAQAEASFRTALQLRSDYAAAQENLGDLHARLALKAWEAASRADADDPEVRDKRHRLLPLLDASRGVESTSLALSANR